MTGFGATMREAGLRIAALFSYCGGPLFIADLLKPRHDSLVLFLVTFFPVGLMVFAAFFLDDPIRERWSARIVAAGRLGLFAVLLMNVYALWCFVAGARVPDQSLHYCGIAVGLVWSVVYLRAAQRWTSATEGVPVD